MEDDETTKVTMEREAQEVMSVSTDDRGRAYLGSDLKDSEVEIAILEVRDKDE